MSYGLCFLVNTFFICIALVSTISAQISENTNLYKSNGAKIFAGNENATAIKNDAKTGDWKIKQEFNDSKRSFFTKQKRTDKFKTQALPFLADLPEKYNEKPEFNTKHSEENEEKPTNYRFKRGEKEIGIEFGISPFHPTKFGEQEYDLDDRKLGLITARWGRFFGTVNTVTYQYLFEANPIVYSYRNELRNPAYVSPTQTPNEPPTVRGNTFGFSVTPVAFRAYFFSKNRFKPFAQIGGGILFTNKPMPTPESTYYNFAGYFGGGALYHVTRKQGISVHYRYYHLSNFNTSDPNLGYNANTFSIGYSFFYGK